ncbi:MAG TPA: hypothetical protein VJ912_03065, partial [Candidatus Nanoarchaeia archaeon]|nr:hypothetical protein [Candidatus Nanoarchaeia archaeon]
MSEKEKIKKFVEKFFQNLGCDVSYEPSPENLEEKGILKIQNVPKRFAKFYGKEEPYYFYFNESENISNGEYVTKGSYILSCINKFLENKGETTLLKIKFEEKPRKIIEDRFTLRNCKISEISSKNEYEYLERFTFLTTFQYLNKKEEEITKLFVKSNNGEVIDFDISKYETEEGKKRDLKQLNFEKDYEAAKNKLKEKIQEKTNSLKQKLSENLEKEKQRIESHYIEQLKDDKKNLEKLKKQLDDLEPGEKNSKKIIKTREQIEELSSEERKKELEKDKNSSIKQEIQKHSLNIKNKLINTTIICSPIIQYRVYFKTPQNMKRLVNIEYNVLEDKISGVKCDVCQKELNEIILCSSGHLICRECGFRCEECGEILCKKCPTFKCPDCGKTVCKNCVKRCPVCRKTKCSNHFMKESFHKQEICKKCAEMCSDCGEFFSPENIRKTKSGKNLCEKC